MPVKSRTYRKINAHTQKNTACIMNLIPFDFRLLKKAGPASYPRVKQKNKENSVTKIPGIVKEVNRLNIKPTNNVPIVAPKAKVRILISPIQYPKAKHMQIAKRGF
jgi:hypothetical protein